MIKYTYKYKNYVGISKKYLINFSVKNKKASLTSQRSTDNWKYIIKAFNSLNS